jgi:cell wall-associated NlpC family hydrolase
VESVNVAGAVTGYVVDSLQERHSFVRTASGKITTFDIPGQLHAPYSWIGATGDGINAKGQIAGRWRDANAALHGYLLLPEE